LLFYNIDLCIGPRASSMQFLFRLCIFGRVFQKVVAMHTEVLVVAIHKYRETWTHQCILNGRWLERTERNLINFKWGSVWIVSSFHEIFGAFFPVLVNTNVVDSPDCFRFRVISWKTRRPHLKIGTQPRDLACPLAGLVVSYDLYAQAFQLAFPLFSSSEQTGPNSRIAKPPARNWTFFQTRFEYAHLTSRKIASGPSRDAGKTLRCPGYVNVKMKLTNRERTNFSLVRRHTQIFCNALLKINS